MGAAFLLYFKTWFLLAVFSFCFFLVGRVCLLPARKYFNVQGIFTRIFIETLLGFLLCVIVYAFCRTGFKTVTLLALAALAFIKLEVFLGNKINGKSLVITAVGENPEWKKVLLLLLGGSVLIFTWFFTFYIRPGSAFGLLMPDMDKVFYAGRAQMMGVTGNENWWGVNNLFGDTYSGVTPYHYFDLWLTDLFATCSFSTHIISLLLLAYPFLCLLTLLGIFSLIESFSRFSYLKYSAALLLLFAGGTYFKIHTPYLTFVESPMESFGEKYGVYYPFIILIFLFLINNHFTLAFCTSLLLPVLSIGMMPVVFPAMVLWVLVLAFKRKLRILEIVRLGFYMSIVATLFFIFYSPGQAGPYVEKDLLAYTDLRQFDWQNIKVSIIEFVYRVWQDPLRVIGLHILFIVAAVMLFIKRKENRFPTSTITLTVCVYLCALFVLGVFYKFVEVIQLYSDAFVFVNVFCMVVVVALFFGGSARSVGVKILGVLILFFLLAKITFARYEFTTSVAERQGYSEEYLEGIKEMSTGMQAGERTAALFAGNEIEPDKYMGDMSGVDHAPLAFVKGVYPVIDLNAIETIHWNNLEEMKEVQQQMFNRLPFTVYRQQNRIIDVDSCRALFIKENKIKYLIISGRLKPGKVIEDLVEKQVTDKITKERFVRLK